MNLLFRKIVFCFIWIIFSTCLMTANATEFKLKGITISDPHLVVFGKNAKSGAGYFVVSNNSSSAFILNEVRADFGAAMLHKTVVDKKGIAKMEHLKNIVVPSNGSIKLEPGGAHIMFINIDTELNEDKKYPITLIFEGQGSLDVDLTLKSRRKNKTAHKHNHKHKSSHKHDH